MFALPSQCTLLENLKKFFFQWSILNLIRVLTLPGVLVAVFCVRRLKFVIFTLHYITCGTTFIVEQHICLVEFDQ